MGNYLKDKLGANVNRREQRPHTHTVTPVWRAERGSEPLGGVAARYRLTVYGEIIKVGGRANRGVACKHSTVGS